MKILFLMSILLCTFSFSQDSTYKCYGGWVEVKRIGVGDIHSVEGRQSNGLWISGKVKRVNYEYMYTRTFYGSTQPANPEQFYKPVKKKSFYLVPAADIVIKYGADGQVFQTFSMDSLILRSYLEDGTPRDIYYLNSNLQADSIYRFYENGNLKTKLLGATDQLTENVILSLGYQPEMFLRQTPFEWMPGYDRIRLTPLAPNYPGSVAQVYPEKQFYYHGNGKPYLVISWLPDSANNTNYQAAYSFFDPQGNAINQNQISSQGRWTGMSYEYYTNGALKWAGEMCDDQFCGNTEHWNRDGTLNRIEYRTNFLRDSVVYFKQLPDTLLSWRAPMNFEWNQMGNFYAAKHRHCEFGFGNDGNVWYVKLDGEIWEAYQKYPDQRLQLEHFGKKDELGLPHGQWVGVNALNDTVYEVNFHHGWLHGIYRVHNSCWEHNWTRTYHMGFEIDSSVYWYKGDIREIHYFGAPGKLAKKAMFMKDGQLSYVDTTLNGKDFFRLRSVHFTEGWTTAIGCVDTASKQIYTKRFYFSPDSLSVEIWTDYSGTEQERKEYYRTTGTLKTHWKSEGFVTLTEESPTPGETAKKRVVQLAFRYTYDEAGNLIKKERLENGVVVE